jgi:hypothetical protein
MTSKALRRSATGVDAALGPCVFGFRTFEEAKSKEVAAGRGAGQDHPSVKAIVCGVCLVCCSIPEYFRGGFHEVPVATC